MAFVHLHVHSQYSLLDGTMDPSEVAKAAAACGMPAVALTDTSNLYGAVAFYKACKDAGVRPVIGAELHVEPRGIAYRGDATSGYQLVALVEDEVGYRNLCQLVTRAIFDGNWYKPRVDLDLLRAHHEGLIFLTGGRKGAVGRCAEAGRPGDALEQVRALAAFLGPDQLYLELQDVGLPGQDAIAEHVRRIAAEVGRELVVTNGVHYKDPEQASIHELLNAISRGQSLGDEERILASTDQAWFKPEGEMRALFPEDAEALDRTVTIAERCHFAFDFGTYHFPATTPPDAEPGADTDANWAYFYRAFPPPRDYGVVERRPEGAGNLDGYFAWYARRGLDLRLKRIAEDKHPAYRERLETELSIIIGMGFPAYLLIVAEFINWSKDEGIPVGPGRGSAAGSLVTWAMRITDIDPLQYDLLFERFLNPERVSMPDIDVDFCQDRREEVIEHVREKYGTELVSQIITYGKLKAKAAVRDVARVLGLTFTEADRIAKLVPEALGTTLDDALEQVDMLRTLREGDPKVRRVLDLALAVEGLCRQTGVHAAGVVIADRPLVEYAPLYRDEPGGGPVVQYDMKWAEAIGLIKFDFLGLKTLDQIRDAVAFVERNHGVRIDMADIPLDDEAAYRLLQQGDALGIFQLESSGMRDLLARLKPSCIDDMVALVALYRPGPLSSGMTDDFVLRKHNAERIEYPLPMLRPILESTYGTIIYQEQVMQVAQVMAGYSLGEADLLRRAMGKKKAEEMDKQQERFVSGSVDNGIPAEKAHEIFDLMAKFAAYGFNKCVVAETELLHAETGERATVGDLLDNPRPFRVHALGEDGRLRSRAVLDVVWNGVKDVFEMRTDLGHRIVATGNHPFRTLDGWTNLEALTPGDRIAVPRELSIPARASWPEHELITLGWLLSEGNTCHPGTPIQTGSRRRPAGLARGRRPSVSHLLQQAPSSGIALLRRARHPRTSLAQPARSAAPDVCPSCLYFYNNDPNAIEDFAEAVSCFPDTSARVATRSNGRMEVCASSGPAAIRADVRGNLAEAVRSEPLRCGAFQWAGALGLLGSKAPEKFVPAEVFQLREEDLALFLGRLWTGDGFLASRNLAVPYYATSSEQLARDVQTLLLRLGIVSRVKDKEFRYRGGIRIGFTVHLLGEDSRGRFIDRVVPHIVGRQLQVGMLRRYHRGGSGATSKDTVPPDVRRWVAEEKERTGLTWREIEARSGVSMKEFTGRGSHVKRGFRRGTVARLAEFFGSQRLADLAWSDVYWDRVVSVVTAGRRDTYDLEVEEDHNFVADGIVVHNSHSAAYGYISYQTAWLKAHYRPEYMAALMTIESANTDKLLVYIDDCRRGGIRVEPVDVNHSYKHFHVPPPAERPGGDLVRFGLAAVKNVGSGAVDAILEAREEAGGAFEDMNDFLEALDYKRVNKRVVENLVKAGAFDGFGLPRRALFEGLEDAVSYAQRRQDEKAAGQALLFAALPQNDRPSGFRFPDVPEWPLTQKLAYEHEVLGLYLTGHPMQSHARDVERFATCTLSTLDEADGDQEVRVVGLPAEVRTIRTKRGDKMAFVKLADEHASVECVFFSDPWARSQRSIQSGEPLLVTGRIEVRDGDVKILAESAERIADVRIRSVKEVCFRLTLADLAGERLETFLELLREQRGECESSVLLEVDGVRAQLQLPMYRVEPSTALEEGIQALFGRPDVVALT